MSCSGDLVRIPWRESMVPDEFKKGYGYNNGGFILRSSDPRFEYLCDRIARNSFDGSVPEVQKIPCGKCTECRLEYSKQWAQRLVCESSLYCENWFITLTYDEDHLLDCIDYTVSPWTHSLDYVASLRKDHFVKWKKDFLEYMRYYYNVIGIRFYMCGEYGSKNHRPHFHAILFNCPIPDLKLVKSVNLGGYNYCYYSSEILKNTWKRGFVMLGNVSWNSCAYVARYVMKKMQGPDHKLYYELCDLEGYEPIQSEYVNMSRRPGIAREYFENTFRDVYMVDKVILPDGKSCKPCKYFDRLYDIECPEDLERIKSDRVKRAQLRTLNLFRGKTSEQKVEIEQKNHEALERALVKLKRDL